MCNLKSGANNRFTFFISKDIRWRRYNFFSDLFVYLFVCLIFFRIFAAFKHICGIDR